MKSIDKALYQATDALTETDKITGKRTLSKDRQSQISEGNARIEKLIDAANAEGIRYNETLDSRAYARLERVFNDIHSVSHLKDEEWHVLFIPGDQFNAYVTGGTYVVVYQQLEKELDDDAELAAVIGHELAHVSANHIGERQAHLTFASLTGSDSASRSSFQSAYTHEDEKEADKIGTLYASLAGYDPYGASRIWQRFYEEYGDHNETFVDHPVYSERTAQSIETASLVEAYYMPGQVNPDHERILNDNTLFTYKEAPRGQGGDGSGTAAALLTTLESFNQHQAAKIEEMRQQRKIETLEAVNDLLTVKKIDQISPNQWRFTVHYNGNRAIDKLKFTGVLFNRGNAIATLDAASGGYWSPSGTYNVTATSNVALPIRTKFTEYIFKATEVVVY
ncbi:M48 family metallopeptidase [Haliea sp. E17]